MTRQELQEQFNERMKRRGKNLKKSKKVMSINIRRDKRLSLLEQNS